MKIAIHADPVSHGIAGGVGAYVAGLLQGLPEADDDYRLLVAASSDLPVRWRGREIRSRLPLRPLYVGWNYLRLPRIPDGFDVVHATALVIPPAGKAALVATIHDDAVVVFPEFVPAPWRSLYRRGFRRAVAEASALCANSHITKERLVDRYGVEEDRIVVTPLAPGVTPEMPSDLRLLEGLGVRTPYLLHVGTLEPRKNQKALVRAFSSAAGRIAGTQLVLAGSPGWGSEDVLGEIEGSPVRDRIVVTGTVGPAALVTLYRHATAFAFPSHYEGFGIPLLEALAFGIPSVAGSDASLREVAGEAALYIEPADVAGLAEALVALSSHDETRARLTAAGEARARAYSWKRTAEATREAYRRACGMAAS